MALTINKPNRRTSIGVTDNRWRWFNLAATTEIFLGSIVYRDGSGNITKTPVAATTACVGIAGDYLNNATGSPTTDEGLRVEHGQLEVLTLAGVTAGDVGKEVHGSDDSTLTLTKTANTNFVGIIDSIVDLAATEISVLVDPELRVN